MNRSGELKLGTRQIPFLSIVSQFSPSWISPRTPILSMIRPFFSGREGSKSGSAGGVGVGVGVMYMIGVGVGWFIGRASEETV